jgi:hypothetical protein
MSNPKDYTVGWICAIVPEYVAAQAFLDKEHGRPEKLSPGDNNDYALGEIAGHNVVIAVLPDGNTVHPLLRVSHEICFTAFLMSELA